MMGQMRRGKLNVLPTKCLKKAKFIVSVRTIGTPSTQLHQLYTP
jgi:hypothetical protein